MVKQQSVTLFLICHPLCVCVFVANKETKFQTIVVFIMQCHIIQNAEQHTQHHITLLFILKYTVHSPPPSEYFKL